MKKFKSLLFVHGWGFSESFWSDIRKNLNEYDSLTIDLGYIHSNSENNPFIENILNQQKNYIVIGHSLGFIYLLKKFPLYFYHYIAVNSFAKFAQDEDFSQGIALRVLDRMSRRLMLNPNIVMTQFYLECGYHWINLPHFNNDNLIKGIEKLKKEDIRNLIPSIQQKLTVLASTDDPIVSREMTLGSFENCHCYWIEDNTHLLPLYKIKECADIIRKIINNA